LHELFWKCLQMEWNMWVNKINFCTINMNCLRETQILFSLIKFNLKIVWIWLPVSLWRKCCHLVLVNILTLMSTNKTIKNNCYKWQNKGILQNKNYYMNCSENVYKRIGMCELIKLIFGQLTWIVSEKHKIYFPY
jgi:hypothetical protein